MGAAVIGKNNLWLLLGMIVTAGKVGISFAVFTVTFYSGSSSLWFIISSNPTQAVYHEDGSLKHKGMFDIC